MEFGEGDIARSWFGFHNEDQANYALGSFVVASAYSGLSWFRKHHGEIKLAKEAYDNIGKKEMASYKRYRKRRRIGRKYGKRRSKRYRKYGRGSLARRVRRISRIINSKGIKSAEVKYRDATFDWQVSKAEANNQPNVNFASGIVQGLDIDERLGNKIFIRKINLQFFISASTTSTNFEHWVRWIVFRDAHPDSDSVSPFYNEVFQTNFAPAGAVAQWQANLAFLLNRYVNNKFKNRFQWLWTGVTKVSKDGGTAETIKVFKKKIKVFKPMHFVGDVPEANRGPGQLYLMAFSTEPSATVANMPRIVGTYRISYTDC